MERRRLPPLSALRAFEAAARHLSFKEAAGELGVTATAVSHQVRLLEAILGLRLFERRTRQVVLTAAGRTLYPVLREGFDSFAATLDGLGRRRPAVTVSATTAFTARWMVPRVASFAARHPDIELHLHASDAVVDLTVGAVDVAVRYAHGPFPGLCSARLFTDRFGPVCSPRLGLSRADELGRATLLHARWRTRSADTPTWALWIGRAGLPGVDAAAGVTFSDEAHAVQAAIAGQGVALASLVMAGPDLAAGHLVQPFGPVLDGRDYHVVCTAAAAERAEVRAVRDWLFAGLDAG